jgi:hypothetical protein
MGIKGGEWQFVTIPQLKALMGPNFSTAARVYACGLIHSVGQTNKRLDRKGYSDKFALKHPDRAKTWMTPNRGRLATRIAQGKVVPLRPIDIKRELNELDPAKTLTSAAVRKTLRGLERQGLSRAGGRPVHGERSLFFYARPLASRRNGAAGPELVDGVKFDPIKPASVSDQQTYAILSFRKVFVKSSLNLYRRIFGDGVNLDPIRPEIDRLFNGVKDALIRLADGVEKGRAYKEDSSSSSDSSDLKEREVCLSGSPDNTGRPSLANEKAEELCAMLVGRLSTRLRDQVPGGKLLDDILAALAPASLADLSRRIDQRIDSIKSYGMVLKLARDAALLARTPKTETSGQSPKRDEGAKEAYRQKLRSEMDAQKKARKSARQEWEEAQERSAKKEDAKRDGGKAAAGA